MKRKIFRVLFALVLVCSLGLVTAVPAGAITATIEVSQPVQVTSNEYYERGQSIVYDGTNYWLFYGRSAACTGTYQNEGGNDVDAGDYALYYKKATTVAGLAGATETAVTSTTSPTTIYNGETDAAYYDGKVWVFANIESPSYPERGAVYGWYSTDGTSWTAVGPFWDNKLHRSLHHDEIVFNGELWIAEGAADGDVTTRHGDPYDPTTQAWVDSQLSLGIGSGGGIIHFFVDDGELYLAGLKCSSGLNIIYQYDATNTEWDEIDSVSSEGWDPTLFKVDSTYVFAQAPWVSEGGGRQYNIAWSNAALDSNFFGDPVSVTEGRYGTNTWTDMWPIGFTQGDDSYLFFTSERNPDDPTSEITGNIWYLPVDWTVTNNHYTYIQEAIDAAVDDDTISVAEGTYREYLHITTDGLTIEGAGIDQSIIDLDGLTPYWHYRGQHGGSPSGSFASRAGVLISGYGSPDQIVEGVTFRGFTVKNAGLNPPITATGTHTGSDNAVVLTDTSASWTPGALVGQWVHNYGDKDPTDWEPARSYGQITANTATTVTATLSGGVENDWDADDPYLITPYQEFHNTFWIHYPNYDGLRGIGIGNGKDILIQYCKITHSGYGGITTGYARCVSTHKYSEGITIDNCIVTDHPTAGINIGNHVGPFTITNNVCERIKRPAYHDATREYSGYGIQVSGTKKYGTASGLIADNECHDNGFEGIIVTKYTDGVVVEDNKVTGHNFDEDGAGIFLYHWDHPEWCKNHIVRNNTVTGNIRGIIAYYAQVCTIEGNTITTNSSDFDSGQAAIKIDNANNIVVKNNTISCDGVGIRVTNEGSYENTLTSNTITGAMFAGVRVTNGAYDNTFEYNTITGTTVLTIAFQAIEEETQGDGVFIDDDAGVGNVFHFNNICDNADDGMENQVTTTTVDATNNWWGSANGPYNETSNPDGLGNAVSDNVKYSPWCASDDADPEVPGYQAPTPMVWGVSTNGTIQEAINDFASPDDTITVATGTYDEYVDINQSLTLSGQPGAIVRPTGEGGNIQIIAIEADNVTVEGFEVDGSGLTVAQAGIGSATGCTDVTIQDNTIHDIANPVKDMGVGISLWRAGEIYEDILIEGNTVYNTDRMGIYVGAMNQTYDAWLLSNNITIRDNEVHDTMLNPNEGETFPGGCGGIALDAAKNCTIEGNTIYGTASTMPGIFLAHGSGTGNQILGNEVYNQAYGIAVEIDRGDVVFRADSAAPKIHSNNIHDNSEYGLIVLSADEKVVNATNNWWDDASGPYHATTNPDGLGDTVSDNVDYDPWFGAGIADSKSKKTEAGDDIVVDATDETDTTVVKSGDGTPTITITEYEDNPGDGAPGGFSSAGKYIDVHIDDTIDVDEIEIRNYYTLADIAGPPVLNEATLRLSWWNGTAWVGCSNSGVTYLVDDPTYRGYVWAKIRAPGDIPPTIPTLDDLAGTPFMSMGRPPAPPAGGGGGGLPALPAGTTNVRGMVSFAGVFYTSVTANSEDRLCTLTIPARTVGLTEELEPLTLISMLIMDDPPPPPEGAHIIGLPHDFQPSSATFDPPATLTCSYDPDNIPEGIAEGDLVLAYYDQKAGKWVTLEGTVDTGRNTITALISHFTAFAKLGYEVPEPAAFTPGSLVISPTEVDINQTVNVSLSVANTGGMAGSYTVTLKIDDEVEAAQQVTVGAGASETVTFTTSRDVAGSYSVDVNGLSGSFTVKEEVAPAPPAPPPPAPPPPEVKAPINWPVVGGIIAAAIVAGLAIFFLIRRRRAY